MGVNVLGVLAHADDEAGCGGTLHRLKKAGHDLTLVITTTVPPDRPGRASAEVREAEFRKSCAILGATPVVFPYQEEVLHRSFDESEQDPGLLKRVGELVADLEPGLVITHTGQEANPDHEMTFVAVRRACFPKGANVEVFCTEEHSSGRETNDFRPQSLGFYPTHYVDISAPEILDIKRRMYWCHTSQDPEGMWGYLDEAGNWKTGRMWMQRERGKEAGVEHAEAFVRLTRYGELSPELREIFIPTPPPYKLPRPFPFVLKPEAIGLTA